VALAILIPITRDNPVLFRQNDEIQGTEDRRHSGNDYQTEDE
jgi:hypothetical protein